MAKVKLFLETTVNGWVHSLLQVDDFVLRLPHFECEIPFKNPVFTYSDCSQLAGKEYLGFNDWLFPSALQAVKIQASWFDILCVASKYIPFDARFDRSDNPIWIWTSVEEDGGNFRFDVNSGDMELCIKGILKAYPFLVRNLYGK